ncbi:MFS transporter [Spirosoma sp. SC4-14]|uniref:MFS transporter n=1 Tax=Spirosoma sp. SC4-14 TaxID=3128900 RepID=UPI0030D1A1F2
MNTQSKLATAYSNYRTTVLLLGVGHGLSDAAAGYLIGSLSQNSSFVQIGSAVLLYNALAFGGQLPAGIWLDRIGHYRKPAVLSLLGMVIALGLLSVQVMWVAIALAGLSSAVFHVAGGATTLVCFPDKSRFVGLFSAFGVMGLAMGGWAGAMQYAWVSYALIVSMSALVLLIIRAKFPLARRKVPETVNSALDRHDYLMIVLLMAIALRSAIWNSLQLLYDQQYDWLLYMALAAMVGKLIGGWIADRVPWKTYAIMALTIAIPALSWGYRQLFWLMLGTGLLQSLTPLSVIALQRIVPDRPAAVSGVAFGLAIAVGGLFLFAPFVADGFLGSQFLLAGVLTVGLYYASLRRFKLPSNH